MIVRHNTFLLIKNHKNLADLYSFLEESNFTTYTNKRLNLLFKFPDNVNVVLYIT